jgi:hypothetical protein
MRTKLKSIIISLALAISSLIAVPMQSATAAEWVTGLAWGNLHVEENESVFERYRRQFNNAGGLLVDSETQHDSAWIKTSENSVTVVYSGGLGNAGKQVQFLLEALDTTFTDDVVGDENIVTADSEGKARITVTLTNTPVANDTVLVSIKNGTTTVGPMVLQWQDSGYYPIIKLMGSPTGIQAICDDDHACEQNDLQEKTWEWSVFKRDWLPEYSQVYVKSYLAGSTIKLKYRVTDIWGDVIVGKNLHIDMDSKCSKCKWGNFVEDIESDANGEVVFSVPNKNTVAEALKNSFVNADTKKQEGGYIALGVTVTANELEESADMFWPQITSNMSLKSTASMALLVKERGGVIANSLGSVVVGEITNPPLKTDPFGLDQSDQVMAHFTVNYEKNADKYSNWIYAPEVSVTSDNGGYAAVISTVHGRPNSSFLDISQMSQNLKFNYAYNYEGTNHGVDIVFAGTKPGITTFTIAIGATKKTFTQEFFADPNDARLIRAVAPAVIGIPKVNSKVSFEVVDRFGNGVPNLAVDVVSTGVGSITSPLAQVMTDANGRVTVTTSSTGNGAQTVSATVSDPGGETQIGDGPIAEWNVPASVTTANAIVNWGAVEITMTAAKGSFKVAVKNGKNKTVVITKAGKKIAGFKLTAANQVKTIKLVKGTYSITAKVGTGGSAVTKVSKLVIK